MTASKSQQVNLRMSPQAKALLRLAANREHRSASNMVEYLVRDYCEQHKIDTPPEASPQKKPPKKGAA
jgi:hypothetical protein